MGNIFLSLQPRKYFFLTGFRRDEVTGEWRRLNNEELNDLYWGMEEIA